MHVEVKDPDDKEILSRVYSAEGKLKLICLFDASICKIIFLLGKFPFTSHTPGEHTICLYSNTSQWFSGSQLRVHFDIQVGEHAVDYAQGK